MKTKTATEHQQVPAGETVTWNKRNDPPKTGTVIAFVKPGEDAFRVIDRYRGGVGESPRLRFKERRSRLPRYLLHVAGERAGFYAPSAGMIESAWREARARAAFREASPPLPVEDSPVAGAHFEYVDPPLPFDALPLFAAATPHDDPAVWLSIDEETFARELRRIRRLLLIGHPVETFVAFLALAGSEEQWEQVTALLSSPPSALREVA